MLCYYISIRNAFSEFNLDFVNIWFDICFWFLVAEVVPVLLENLEKLKIFRILFLIQHRIEHWTPYGVFLLTVVYQLVTPIHHLMPILHSIAIDFSFGFRRKILKTKVFSSQYSFLQICLSCIVYHHIWPRLPLVQTYSIVPLWFIIIVRMFFFPSLTLIAVTFPIWLFCLFIKYTQSNLITINHTIKVTSSEWRPNGKTEELWPKWSFSDTNRMWFKYKRNTSKPANMKTERRIQ